MFWKPLIAIDIGSSAVKIVEIGGTSSNKTLLAMGLELLPPGAVVAGEIRDEVTVLDAIKTLMTRLNLQPLGRRVAIAMSGNTVVVRKVNLQLNPDMSLEEQIISEAEQHLSVDVNDYHLRSLKLESKMVPEGFAPVLVVGAKRDAVDHHLKIVRELGMRAGVVDCDVFCVNNMYEFNYPSIDTGSIMLFNMGATKSELAIVSRDGLEFVQDLNFGGEEYSRKICDTLHVDHEHAETLKVSASIPGVSGYDDVKALCTEVNQQIAAEIKSIISNYLESVDPTSDAGQINIGYLSGGGCRAMGFDAALAEVLGFGVQISNPFFKVNANPKHFDLDYMSRQAHLYGVAVGLGLRSMNDVAA